MKVTCTLFQKLIFPLVSADIKDKLKSMKIGQVRFIVREQQLSKESTIYNYRLLLRVYHKTFWSLAYWTAPGLYFIWDLVHLMLIPMLLGLAVIPLMHFFLTYLYFKLK